MMKRALDILLSLKTTIVLTLCLLFLLLYGSFIMPVYPEFQALNSMPLLSWMSSNDPAITWWLWGSLGVLSLLSANTVFCSVESLLRKRRYRHWLLITSPQVIHIGFLFILLAHLYSSVASFKAAGYVAKGSVVQLPNGLAVKFNEINAAPDPSGYIADWSAHIEYLFNGQEVALDTIGPNSPSFHDGLGIYIKTVQLNPSPIALIEVSREPGAIWALIGGIFFLAGTLSLLGFKMKRRESLS